MPTTTTAPICVLLGLALGVVVGACYTQPFRPPGYRYPCSAEADCVDPETCQQGRCLVSCTVASFAEDCASNSEYTACLNGTCTTVCRSDEDCGSPDSCVALSEEPEAVGLCGTPCGGPDDCPSEEQCLAGFCSTTCDPEAEDPGCPEGTACTEGICLQS